MKYFFAFFLFIFLFFNHAFALYDIQKITEGDIIEKIKILDNLKKNFLISSSNKKNHNIDKIEYYSFELFERKLKKISWINQNSDHELMFAFFKELYFNNNDKLNNIFSCFSYYSTTCNELIKSSSFPEYLMLLPAVLTGYDYKNSTEKGVGIWRMNYAVSMKYKLLTNNCIDERYDPYKSSVAAYNYLEHLQKLYNNFDLAVCAYFSSPIVINNSISSMKKDEEFINFLPKDVVLDFHFFKALVFIYYLREEFNFLPAEVSYPLKTDSVFISKRFHFEPIINKLNISAGEIEFLNPQYKFSFSSDSNYIILPSHLVQTFRSFENELVFMNDSLYFSGNKYIDIPMPENNSTESIYHFVKRGENLSQIARKYNNVTVDDIVRLNKLKSADKIEEGQKLIIFKNEN